MRDDWITFKHKAYCNHVHLLHHQHTKQLSTDTLIDTELKKKKIIHILLTILTHIIKLQISEFRSKIFGLYLLDKNYTLILYFTKMYYILPWTRIVCVVWISWYSVRKKWFCSTLFIALRKIYLWLLIDYNLRVTPWLRWLITGLSP
jgi:hypothetical protein